MPRKLHAATVRSGSTDPAVPPRDWYGGNRKLVPTLPVRFPEQRLRHRRREFQVRVRNEGSLPPQRLARTSRGRARSHHGIPGAAGWQSAVGRPRHGQRPAQSVRSLGCAGRCLALLTFRLPYYLAVSVVYGILAWRTGSILPGMVLHSIGDAVSNVVAWRRGPPVARPLVWQTGPDLHFEMTLLAAIVLALIAAWAFRRMDPRRAAQ